VPRKRAPAFIVSTTDKISSFLANRRTRLCPLCTQFRNIVFPVISALESLSKIRLGCNNAVLRNNITTTGTNAVAFRSFHDILVAAIDA
jgi:hypothetical protein